MKTEITELVEKMLSEQGYNVKADDIKIQKNNGITMYGICIKEDTNISPTFYYNPEWTPEQIAIYVTKKYPAHRSPKIALNDFLSHDGILDRVYPILVNREANRGLIMDAVHEPLADIEIMFRIDVETDEERGSILIRNDLAEYLKISHAELLEAAERNIQGKGVVKNIYEAMCEMAGKQAIFDEDDYPMYTITYPDIRYGAGAILDKTAMARIEEKLGERFYLIPSSIHELIAIRADADEDFVMSMIEDVNRSEVPKQDFLSNTLYAYENGTIKEVRE